MQRYFCSLQCKTKCNPQNEIDSDGSKGDGSVAQISAAACRCTCKDDRLLFLRQAKCKSSLLTVIGKICSSFKGSFQSKLPTWVRLKFWFSSSVREQTSSSEHMQNAHSVTLFLYCVPCYYVAWFNCLQIKACNYGSLWSLKLYRIIINPVFLIAFLLSFHVQNNYGNL